MALQAYRFGIQNQLSAKRFNPLRRENEAELVRHYKRGDPLALERVVLSNLKNVYYWAWSFNRQYRAERYGIHVDDLVGAAILLIHEYAPRIDPDSGFRFITYFKRAVHGEWFEMMSRACRIVWIPRDAYKKGDTHPEAFSARQSLSIDALIETGLSIPDPGADPEAPTERKMIRALIARHLFDCPFKEVKIFLRYIGCTNGVQKSESAISRLYRVYPAKLHDITERVLQHLYRNLALEFS